MADLSQLPEVVQVMILTHLPLRDRYRVALTCKALNAVFYHPSLWRIAEVKIRNCWIDRYNGCCLDSSEISSRVIQKFGKYVQELHIVMTLSVQKDACEHVNTILRDLSMHGRLEKLSLCVSGELSKFDSRTKRHPLDLSMISELISCSGRLCSFSLLSWPQKNRFDTIDIFDMLLNNKKIVTSLAHLNIFYVSALETTNWVGPPGMLPSDEQIFQIVQNFALLREIDLHFSLVTSDLLRKMRDSNHRSLKRLRIMVQLSRQHPINDVQNSEWLKLSQTFPELRVEFNFVNLITMEQFRNLLKPEIPVSAFYFMKFSKCSPEFLSAIIENYSLTLNKFISYTNGQAVVDSALIDLVNSCENLNHLVFHGTIFHETVQKLAKIRQSSWKCFEFKEKAIRMGRPLDSKFDDLVLFKDESGSDNYCLVRNMREMSESEDNRETQLEDLTQSVSSLLLREWKPVTPVESNCFASTYL